MSHTRVSVKGDERRKNELPTSAEVGNSFFRNPVYEILNVY